MICTRNYLAGALVSVVLAALALADSLTNSAFASLGPLRGGFFQQ